MRMEAEYSFKIQKWLRDIKFNKINIYIGQKRFNKAKATAES